LQALEQGGVTISGLQGMGGIGKTALALKLANHLKPQYPDAQFYLDLKGVSDEPLTPVQAMGQVIRSYHPEAKLPDDENGLRGLYLSLLDGKKALLLDDFHNAIRFFEQSLEIAREIGSRRDEANALWNSAIAYNRLGNRAQPISFAEQAVTIYDQLQSPEAPESQRVLTKWKSEQP
jgi:tetratricopeptide (TPR) repeat protein